MKLKDLYELVWSKPLKQICKEHELAYTDFKQLCTENKIPLPELGYWTKLRFGKPVSKTALPLEIDFHKEIDLEVYKKVKENIKTAPKILYPKKTHPLVTRAKKELNITTSYIDAVGRMKWDRQKNVLPIHTDQKIQKRALSFMNIFLYNMEQRGMKIKFEYGRCNVELYDQTLEINLRQKYHRVRLTDDNGWSRLEFVKSNKLEFLTGYHARKGWLDTEKIKIEERIPNILDYIEKDLTYWRDVRKQQAEEEKLKEIELLKQQEIKRLQKIEEDKTTQLYTDAENWQRAELLRKFMDAKKKNEIRNGTFNKKTEKWLAWVTTKINDLDPLQN
ncbi:hypothetical protein SAMN04488007_3349 [Maribacter aquivivus]|uniref:Uncharacterized protein n=1 Tax=Maribacter aquivivus TaxID=228958 RepID=A0A1M6TSU6_9FLAO|nr:hypothetical protein [Maribacter aquivivus]SHK59989.1 hypothetical protein SAMN04488007_3349 [Maribacter aquivivus]